MKSIFYKILTFILILLPFCTLTYIFFKYSIDIPHWDDHALKAFQVNYNKSETIFEKIQLLFAQHNEHRIALTRFFSLLIYKVKGTIDYRWLMILGNISLLGVFFIFYKIFEKYKIQFVFLAPISFVIFGIQNHETLFWGMASVQNFWVVFLAILTFYLLTSSQNKYAFQLAILSNFLAIFTSGNGILVPLIGIILLLILKQKKYLIYWLSSSCVFLFFYFWGYHNAPDATKTHASLQGLVQLPQAVIFYLGTLIDTRAILPNKRELIATFFGGILLTYFLFFVWRTILKKYNSSINQSFEEKKIDLFLLGIILFSLGTALLVSFSRLGYGIGVLFGSKYKIYSSLCFIVFYIILLKSLKDKARKFFDFIAIFASSLLWIYGYFLDYQEVRFTRQERICDEFNWTYNQDPVRDSAKIKESQKIYNPQKRFYIDFLSPISDSTKNRKYIFEVKQDNEKIYIKNPEKFIFDKSQAENGRYIILISSSKTYIFPTRISLISKNILNTQFIAGYGYNSEILKLSVDKGDYYLGELKIENNTRSIKMSSQLIDIQGVKQKETKKNW